MAASSLSPALMAFLAALYKHLSRCTLNRAVKEHCFNSVFSPLSENLLEQVTATFRHLDILLCCVF